MNQFRFDTSHGIIISRAKLTNNKQSIVTKLAVDTGASLTMISVEAAVAIGIDPSRPIRHIEITAANGVIFVPIVKIAEFECFGANIKQMEVICHNLPPESCVEGLLGLNFLKKAKIVIDFSQNIISIPK